MLSVSVLITRNVSTGNARVDATAQQTKENYVTITSTFVFLYRRCRLLRTWHEQRHTHMNKWSDKSLSTLQGGQKDRKAQGVRRTICLKPADLVIQE